MTHPLQTLNNVLDQSVEIVQRHRTHQLPLLARQRIYYAINDSEKAPIASSVKGWIAVLTAEHVVHFLEEMVGAVIEEDQPRRLLEVVKRALQNQLSVKNSEFRIADETVSGGANLLGDIRRNAMFAEGFLCSVGTFRCVSSGGRVRE